LDTNICLNLLDFAKSQGTAAVFQTKREIERMFSFPSEKIIAQKCKSNTTQFKAIKTRMEGTGRKKQLAPLVPQTVSPAPAEAERDHKVGQRANSGSRKKRQIAS
jgi:hypothetical protein